MKKVYFSFFCLLVSHFLVAQSVHPKLSAALQNALDSMHQILDIRGISAAVQLPTDAIWVGTGGLSTVNPVDSVGPEYRFASGSTTKTITGACILQLVDEGQLSIDDSLHSLVNDFEYIDPNITVRQLLQHTSGIYDVLQNPNFNAMMSFDVSQIWELEDVISTFIQPPAFPPGTSWAYSNTNYILLGHIIETITGQSFHEEIKERFFNPLELDSYSNPAFDPPPNPAAHLWLDITGDGVLDDAFLFLTVRKSMFSSVGPAGGYFAKPADLAKWMRTYMSGSLLSADTWEAAKETVNSTLPGGTQYGLGLTTRDYLGYLGYGHGGDLGGYSTQAFYFPEKDVSIVVYGNDASINSWHLTNTVRALLQTFIECEDNLTSLDKPVIEKTAINVFPNPFSDRLTIELDATNLTKTMQVNITNLLGEVVWSADAQTLLTNGRFTFATDEFSNLPTGIYQLNVYDGNTFLTGTKIVKHKK